MKFKLSINGQKREIDVAADTPLLAGRARERANRAEVQRGKREPLDLPAAEARYSELTGERLHA